MSSRKCDVCNQYINWRIFPDHRERCLRSWLELKAQVLARKCCPECGSFNVVGGGLTLAIDRQDWHCLDCEHTWVE